MVLLGNSIEHLRGGGTTVLHKNLSENRGMNHFPTFYENRKTLIQKSVKGIKKQQQLPGHYSSCLNYQQTEIIKILKNEYNCDQMGLILGIQSCVNLQVLINVIHYINRIKKKAHMINLIDTKKYFTIPNTHS